MQTSTTGTTSARSGYSAGVDVGGTKTATILLDAEGRVVAHDHAPTRKGAEAVALDAAQAVRRVLAQAQVPPAALVGVGIGVPGVVDPDGGAVANAVNLGIEGAVPLAVLAQRALAADEAAGAAPVRVRLENDLNAAVLGAAHHLAGTGEGAVDDLAFVALGTGLAAGIMLDGRLRRGPHQAAGEIGHLQYVPDGLPCKCGQSGCLERYASGSAIDALWPSRTGRPAPVELFEAAAAGDDVAVRVRDEFVAAVAAAVRVLVLTCDVGRIVIGGGVSQLGEPLLRALVAELDRGAASSPFLRAADLPGRVRLAPAGVPVGAVGAALVGRGGI